ncbi:hypothetical protein [Patulibacter minatonensis]|uniref:hypothetical protein n=1 Tax=Patulibacter minatonensis TaxID=298163 RepID=UPI000478BD92|nr:hypothetical protein [Patulibacter minatonensis]
MNRAFAAAALTTLTLGITACGGDGDTLNKKDLTSKAGSICKDFEAKTKAISQPSGTDEKAQIDYYGKVASTLGDFVDELKKLKPADDVKDDWNTLTTNLEKSANGTKTIVEQAKKKDTAGLQKTNQELTTATAAADGAAKKLGLDDCSN